MSKPAPLNKLISRPGCQFCAHVARFGPRTGKPTLDHRHEAIGGVVCAVTDDATALDGSRTTGHYSEAARMWLPMPTEATP